MVHDVLDAFAARDPDDGRGGDATATARSTISTTASSATLLTHMMENPHNITPATHLLFVAKNLERIGDHATNVAEMVYFAATGEHLADRDQGRATSPSIGASRPWCHRARILLLVEDDRALVELLAFHFAARRL